MVRRFLGYEDVGVQGGFMGFWQVLPPFIGSAFSDIQARGDGGTQMPLRRALFK